MRHIVLDTETTGLSPDAGHRVIEIGCIELIDRKPTGRNLHHYLNPGRDSDEEALKVHGLTTEFLRDKPTFEHIAADLLAYVRGATLIIHNAAFDVGFLNKELDRAGLAPLADHVAGVIDTLAMAKQIYPGKRNGLDALCERLGVDNSGRTLHGALLDAGLLADVYIALTRGQEALLIDSTTHAVGHAGAAAVDLRALQLPVIAARPDEVAEHLAILKAIDKASGGKTVWPREATAS
jgi:DNA polymerase III subunit epsilon